MTKLKKETRGTSRTTNHGRSGSVLSVTGNCRNYNSIGDDSTPPIWEDDTVLISG